MEWVGVKVIDCNRDCNNHSRLHWVLSLKKTCVCIINGTRSSFNICNRTPPYCYCSKKSQQTSMMDIYIKQVLSLRGTFHEYINCSYLAADALDHLLEALPDNSFIDSSSYLLIINTFHSGRLQNWIVEFTITLSVSYDPLHCVNNWSIWSPWYRRRRYGLDEWAWLEYCTYSTIGGQC